MTPEIFAEYRESVEDAAFAVTGERVTDEMLRAADVAYLKDPALGRVTVEGSRYGGNDDTQI